MRLTFLFTACLLALGLTTPATAQSSAIAPVVRVNEQAVTQFELEQRTGFIRLLGTRGDLEKIALDALIEDRLRFGAAQALGISLPEEQLIAGMTEFAGRANMTLEAFQGELAQVGIANETFRDFVRAGMLWREVVQTRFAGRVQVSDAEIDRALAMATRQGGARVLLSEIILPMTPEYAAQSQEIADYITRNVQGEAAFAEIASQVSAAPSRDQAGRLDWMPLSNLPPQIIPVVLPLAPGQVSPPIEIPNAVAFFLMRGFQETGAPPASEVSVDFAQLFLPGGRTPQTLAQAQAIRNQVDVCDDLYGVARDMPEDRLVRQVLPMAQVPQDIGLELAKLDEWESSTALVRGDNLVFLMLCGRTLALEESPKREDMRVQLLNQRISSYADNYLAELKADAHIVFP